MTLKRDYLIDARCKCGKKVGEIAAEAGYSYWAYNMVERGEVKRLTADAIQRIANAVGEPANELFEKEVDYIAMCV